MKFFVSFYCSVSVPIFLIGGMYIVYQTAWLWNCLHLYFSAVSPTLIKYTLRYMLITFCVFLVIVTFVFSAISCYGSDGLMNSESKLLYLFIYIVTSIFLVRVESVSKSSLVSLNPRLSNHVAFGVRGYLLRLLF